jgi:hypothetical protein
MNDTRLLDGSSHLPPDQLGGWNDHTCFLAWSLQCGADDRAYLLAQVDLFGQDGFDVVVERDAFGTLWAVNIDGHVRVDELPSAAAAQLVAVGEAVIEIASRCGEPMRDSQTRAQRGARMLMSELHQATRGAITTARDRWEYKYESRGGDNE